MTATCQRRSRREAFLELLDLRQQLHSPGLSDRGRERTEAAARSLERRLAPGRGAEAEALRQLDLREASQ